MKKTIYFYFLLMTAYEIRPIEVHKKKDFFLNNSFYRYCSFSLAFFTLKHCFSEVKNADPFIATSLLAMETIYQYHTTTKNIKTFNKIEAIKEKIYKLAIVYQYFVEYWQCASHLVKDYEQHCQTKKEPFFLTENHKKNYFPKKIISHIHT